MFIHFVYLHQVTHTVCINHRKRTVTNGYINLVIIVAYTNKIVNEFYVLLLFFTITLFFLIN